MAIPKKIVRTGKGFIEASQQKRCPHHDMPMEFKPDEGAWRCPSSRCTYRLVPKAQVERGSAAVEAGDFELFTYKDKDNVRIYLIRSLKSNIMFDITDHITQVKGTGERIRVTMKFDNIVWRE